MKKFSRRLLIALILSLVSSPGLGQNPKTAPTAKPKKVASRRLSSVDGRVRGGASAPSGERDWDLSIGILGGFATANSSTASVQAERQSVGFQNSGYIGGAADLKVKKYIGVEADGFYASAPARSSTTQDLIRNKQITQQRSLQQYGFQGAIKGQYPFRWGSTRLSPKAGIGYGFLTLKDATAQDNSGTSESMTSARGPYALVGLDMNVTSRFSLGVDYARSFGASVEVEKQFAVAGQDSSVSTSGSFDRLRAGAYYQLTSSFTVGAQYQRRQIRFQPVGETSTSTETLNQFLGVLAVGF